MNLGTDNELVEQLFQVTREEKKFIQRELKQYGLNVLQAQALNFIANNPGSIQKELSRYLGKQEASTTNILKVLETQQLVIRRVAADNERRKKLYLSPAGQELVQSVHNVFIELEQRVSAPLDDEEKQAMLVLLRRINGQANFNH